MSGCPDGDGARLVRKHMRTILRTAKRVDSDTVRYRVQYRMSPLGRGLLEAGHVTDSRLYAVGPDPFKWEGRFRDAALHGTATADDAAAFPRARLAMHRGGEQATLFIKYRDYILTHYGDLIFKDGIPDKERRSRMKIITTAYDMGASLDFWLKDLGYGRLVESVKGTSLRVTGANGPVGDFSLSAYHQELQRSADWNTGWLSSARQCWITLFGAGLASQTRVGKLTPASPSNRTSYKRPKR